jgi:hypothetical protein
MNGAIIHYSDVQAVLESSQLLQKENRGTVLLATPEPYVHVKLATDSTGHLKGAFTLRPDPVYERHEYVIEDLDLSCITEAISECQGVLCAHFPEMETK